MDTKRNLQQRIVQGHRKINQLLELAEKLPKGKKRGELGEKYIRMLQALHNLEDGFIELNPGVCLFQEKICNETNKGCFTCWRCPSYLNIRYQQEVRYE